MLLRNKSKARQLYFVGAAGGMERGLVMASALDFRAYHEVLAGPLHGVGVLRALASLVKLGVGSAQALVLLMRIGPRAILLTGGWANLPLALASQVLRIPIVIYLPDIEPGLTIKVLRRFARKVAITVEASARFFPPGKTVVTGYPLQENRLCATKDAARAHFELDPARKTLLVFGGSRGARSVNLALAAHLERLLADGIQILHVTGELDWARARTQAGQLREHPHYHAFPYLHDDMGLAFAAADLALCRAGASTLAELPLFGLPAILAPYPHAWRYQKVNADYLADRGAAIRLNDEDLLEGLYAEVAALLNDEARLSEMRRRSRALANRRGAENLARLLIETGDG